MLSSGSSKNIQNYSFTDTQVKQNQHYYYRIKQIDFDGHTDYTNIEEVTIDNASEFDFNKIYPNPFINNLYLSFVNVENEKVAIEVKDITGKILFQTTIIAETQDYKLELGNLLPGNYFVSARKGNRTVARQVIKLK